MKIPARIQITDGQVALKIETRAFVGEIIIAAEVTKVSFAHIPGIGPVENGQLMEIEISREGGPLH